MSLSVVGYPLDRTKLANFTQVGSGLTGERVGVLLSAPLSPIGHVTWDSRVKFRFANDSQTLPTDAVTQCKRGSASAAWTGTIFHSFTSYRLTLPVQGFSATVAP